MPKIVDVPQKRAEIMEQAARVFAAKGYSDATLLDVARQCGMGRTSLYQYFANKEDLFTFLLDHVLQSLLADMHAAAASSDHAYAKLQQVFTRLGRRFRTEKHLLMAVAEAKPVVKEGNEHIWQTIVSFRQEAVQVLTSILEEGAAHDQLAAVDGPSMAATLYLLVESLVIHLAVTEESTLEQHLANLDFFLARLQRA